MIQYPSILGPNKAPQLPCIAFRKYDGSNLRFEWKRKNGWYKFGSRRQMIDASHDQFGEGVNMFLKNLGPVVEKIVLGEKHYRSIERMTAFAEYFGEKSFAGNHVADDPKRLILIDLHIHKYGFISPREFVNLFDSTTMDVAEVVYEGNLNDTFVQEVRTSTRTTGLCLEEGVVCKGGSNSRDAWSAKVKTQEYLEKLKANFGDKWEEFGE